METNSITQSSAQPQSCESQMLQSLMDALAKANERIVELENNLERAKSIAAEQAENSQLATVSSAVYESINLLLSSVKDDQDFICELIKRYADADTLKDMLGGSLFDSSDQVYDYLSENGMVSDMVEIIRDNGDLDITIEDVEQFLSYNGRSAARNVLDEALSYLDKEDVLSSLWDEMSTQERNDWLSDQLSELSNDDFRKVVTTYAD